MADYLLNQILTKDVKDIIGFLHPYETRLVGGIVRDYFIGKVNPDTDMCTQATPEETTKILEKAGLKVIPTGIKHGTVTAIYNDKPYEITTLRRDISTDGRHAEVAYTDSFEEDSSRRDFTFNALYMDKDGNITDFHGGQADLKEKRIQFIGDASTRLNEDHLRMLRYFRFFARLGCTKAPPELLDTFKQHLHSLKELSWERITDEMLKILNNPNPRRAWMEMDEVGILNALGLPNPDILALNNCITSFGQKTDALLRLACLYHDKNNVYLSKDPRIKFSNAQQKYLRSVFMAIKEPPHYRPTEHQCYIWGKETFMHALMLEASRTHSQETREYCMDALQEARNFQVPTYPLQGRDLMIYGVIPGEQMGKLLKEIEDWWVDNDFPSKKECLQRLEILTTSDRRKRTRV